MSVTFTRVADIYFHFLTHSFIKSSLDNTDGMINQQVLLRYMLTQALT